MAARRKTISLLPDEPWWYKDAIIYELHVRSFYDSDADGIGDFQGLIDKLDYIQDLGVTAVWLLPFYPSPLRDDGYDIADYVDVNPSYGTLRDFKRFLKAAHQRGLRVITELAINHTSNEHPWFQRARRAPPGSRWRNFYVWSDTAEKYQEARIIFEDFETSNWTWDPVAGAYFWHRFYSHQPDLNFDNPEVQKAVFKVLDFWMDLGVDGMRLDAIPYLYEREGTNCENLPETHAFLKRLRTHIDRKYSNRMLLAEANQWPEDAAAYFGDGDECHMNFHFPVMPRMFMSLQLENNFPVLDIMRQTPQIPKSCQWAIFLRNHDELTLEMVTDEDRDYMYRTYAEDPQARINLGIRRRLAPLMGTRAKVELLKGLLFSLPGTPVLYYGDEIGQGDNIYLGDRNGVRTPMQWSPDRNAGFSRANPQRLFLPVVIDPEYHFEAINVEAQQSNPSSLLWWTKRMIALRKQHPVFGRGDIEFLEPENTKVLCFVRTYKEDRVLVVANLSRFTQYVEIDLSGYEGMIPVELFGQTEFPRIGELPYLLTLGGHNFYWFQLTRPRAEDAAEVERPIAQIDVKRDWEDVFSGRAKESLEKILTRYLPSRRWFRGKARTVKATRITDLIPLGPAKARTMLVLLEVEYTEELPETYVLPFAFAQADRAEALWSEQHDVLIAQLRIARAKSREPAAGVLYDATSSDEFANALFSLFGRKRSIAGQRGRIEGNRFKPFRELKKAAGDDLAPAVSRAEQSNTSILYGHSFILKVFRHIEEGPSPDLEITRHLTERAGYEHVPRLAGALEYHGKDPQEATLGVLQELVPNQGDCWQYTLDALDRYFERAFGHVPSLPQPPMPRASLPASVDEPLPEPMADVIGPYRPFVRLLAQRTAEMHLALGASQDDPAFKPEPFSTLYQSSLYQSARARVTQGFQLLRRRLRSLPMAVRPLASELLERRSEIDARIKQIRGSKLSTTRIRCHGDYHLGQVLYTGKDFFIIDFEGEPALPIGVRRLKRSPVYDVCGMLRSFHYAITRALQDGHLRPDDVPALHPWAVAWQRWIGATFLQAYLEIAGEAHFLPKDREELRVLIDFHLIDKCAYELSYELNNRPAWVEVPLLGLHQLLE